MRTKSLDKNAFTLIELLAVVTILGIIMLLAAPKFLGYIEKARVTHIQHDVKVAEALMSEFLMNKDKFPDEWPSVSTSKLRSLASTSELYDVTGYTKEVPDGSYKEVDKEYLKKHMRTHLGGKFYVNEEDVKVYYEDNKPSKIKYKEDLFDREVNEKDIEQDKIKILGYTFPNGIYKNGETLIGNMKFEGIQSGNYYIEVSYIHSKFKTILDNHVEFSLEKDEIKTVDFNLLVEPRYLRGFYDFEVIVKDSDGNVLADYYMEQVIYFAETEWIYYYENDFNEVNRPVAGQLGSLSPDRVNYDYVYHEKTGIDYSSITFDVQSNDNQSGQVRTILPETFGTYEAMIKVPDSDSLLNGFFLYGHNENNHGIEHEIDIEILYYEGKWQVWGTVFNETHKDYVYDGIEPGVIYQEKIDLNFDPSKDYHSYRIDFYDDFVSFAVDGVEFGRWKNKFNYGDMHLYAGNFYTHWMTGEISEVPLEMNVEWIRKGYFK